MPGGAKAANFSLTEEVTPASNVTPLTTEDAVDLEATHPYGGNMDTSILWDDDTPSVSAADMVLNEEPRVSACGRTISKPRYLENYEC